MIYKGYGARIEVDEENGVLHGQVLGINDVITFQGATVHELSQSFVDSIDDYLEFCKERGEEPNKPYSGNFMLRTTPEIHRMADIRAREEGLSLNGWVSRCIEQATSASIQGEIPFPLPAQTAPRETS